MNNINKTAKQNAEKWLSSNISQETKDAIIDMMENRPEEFNESFYKSLEFGTGGLRGIMGIGTNRMNEITVSMATQGFANHVLNSVNTNRPKVVISYDNRNRSAEFAMIVAKVFAGNGFEVHLFRELRPTPVLSFAVREFEAHAGVMITASHNPKEYNGYKAYWNDGGQLVSPHDTQVIEEAAKIKDISQVKLQEGSDNIYYIEESFDEVYLSKVMDLSLHPELNQKHSDIKIAFTPLHGTGITMVPKALERFGFNNIHLVEAQSIVDGNFPTCESPNPEDPSAMKMGLDLAKKVDADILMATDPDADRVGIAVRDRSGDFVLINGNQTATLLTYYILKNYKDIGRLKGNEMIIKTIVTSELIQKIADSYDVKTYDVLTGFKFIADKIRSLEGKETYLCGGEESYGFSIGDFVRDKDAVSSCCILAELVAWAKDQGKTLYDILIDIYQEYGLYMEDQVSITYRGMAGTEKINSMMREFRNSPPKQVIGLDVVNIKDYQERIDHDLVQNTKTHIDLPVSNVLQYYLEDGSRFTVRPSGTEPKIKFYFGVKSQIQNRDHFETALKASEQKIEAIIQELGLQ